MKLGSIALLKGVKQKMKNEHVTIGAPGTQYGNWMSTASIKLAGGIFFLLLIAFILVALLTHATAVKIIIGLLALLFALLFIDVVRIRKALSYKGGRAMDLMQKNLMSYLDWDGNGVALDVGCGSGSLTIRAAKTYPKAKITGIDYWGAGWDYSKALCESNAELEGVGDRCAFEKGNAKKLDFPDETFDALVSNCVYTQIMGKSQGLPGLLMESLRTLKKGSPFAVQDYFQREKMFGSVDVLLQSLKEQGITEVHFQGGQDRLLPRVVLRPYCIRGASIIWGRK